MSDKFGFILKVVELTPDELRNAARNLVQCYPDDLEDVFESEIVHFAALIQSLIDANVFEVTHTFETYIFLQLNENNLNETFPNVNIMLKIYLCMCVTNCKGERSFLKLKLILNYLCNTVGQTRLTSLALLSMESNILRKLDFQDAINNFANLKARRKDF